MTHRQPRCRRTTPAFVPAGLGGVGYDDRPLDLRAGRCEGGGDRGDDGRHGRQPHVPQHRRRAHHAAARTAATARILASHNVATTATLVPERHRPAATTKRVPIVVVGVKPAAADVAQLQSIATNSGGFYRNVTTVFEVTAAVDRAVQLGFVRVGGLRRRQVQRVRPPVSPVIGTCEPRRSVVRHHRQPAAEHRHHRRVRRSAPAAAQQLHGHGRLHAAGLRWRPARVPDLQAGRRLDEADRMEVRRTTARGCGPISTADPRWRAWRGSVSDPEHAEHLHLSSRTAAGGGSVVAFTHGERGVAGDRISGSRDATSPDHDHPRAAARRRHRIDAGAHGCAVARSAAGRRLRLPGFASATFAGDHKDRRSILFFGANDGMIHAVDARTGYEVWAFIPYNLLPKLKTLLDGQPVEQFDFFVDSSPKIAEVKLGGAWRSLLIMGEGAGGTFYQTFDVTEAGMGVAQDADGLSAVSAMLARFDAPNESIVFKWAFPNYSSFNPSLLRDVHCFGRHVGRQGQAVWRPQVDSVVRREDRRVHMVGSRRRPGGQLADDDRRHRRVGLLPRHRDTDSRASGRTEGGERAVSAQRRYGNADRQRVGIDMPDDRQRQRQRIRLRQYRRRQQRTEERAPGRSDGRRQQRQLCGQSSVSRRYRRQVLALHVHVGRQHLRACHDGHEPADLRIVCAAVRRQHRRLHVLRDRQRPAAGDCPRWNRHLQALRSEGQLPVSGRRAVHAQPCAL